MSERGIDITRITLREADGTDTVLDVTEDLHFILGFCKAGKGASQGVPMELMVKGTGSVVGEIFFQIGEANPDLITFCAMKAVAEQAERKGATPKESGTDYFTDLGSLPSDHPIYSTGPIISGRPLFAGPPKRGGRT